MQPVLPCGQKRDSSVLPLDMALLMSGIEHRIVIIARRETLQVPFTNL